MGTRRRFTPEYRRDVASLVLDTGSTNCVCGPGFRAGRYRVYELRLWLGIEGWANRWWAGGSHSSASGVSPPGSKTSTTAAASTPAWAANPPSNTNYTKRPGQQPHKQTVNNLRTTPLPEKSHVIYLGQFSICPENVGIATIRFQSLNNLLGNYVRHLWGTMRVPLLPRPRRGFTDREDRAEGLVLRGRVGAG